MRNPELQLLRAVNSITDLLVSEGLNLVVNGLIVFVSRAGIVMSEPKNFKAVPIDSLTMTIEDLERATSPIMSEETCRHLFQLLASRHHYHTPIPMIEEYRIEADKIQRGVRCPDCFAIPMKKVHAKWLCPACNMESRDAHLSTLQEYRLLFGPAINSRTANQFLLAESPYYAIRLLNTTAENNSSKKRNRIFHLKEDRNLLNSFVLNEMKR